MDLANKDKAIAIVIESLVVGGAERICIDIVKCLFHANYKVELVLFKFKGELLNQVPNEIKIHVVGTKNVTTDASAESTDHLINVSWCALTLRTK